MGHGGTWVAEGLSGPLAQGARLRLLEQTETGVIIVDVLDSSGTSEGRFQLPDVLVIKPLEETTRLQVVYEPAAEDPDTPNQYLDTYRGSLVLHVNAENRVDTVNVLPIEDYVRGVVPAEMPFHWPAAALEAQAIAARGYAATGLRPFHPVWDLDDTPLYQAYAGSNHEAISTNAAVDATSGQLVTYQGAAIRTFYFSSGNGHTESNEDVFGGRPLPYLLSTPDRDPLGRAWDADSPFGTWTTKPFALPLLAAALREASDVPLGEIRALDFSDRTGGGRLVTLRIDGSANTTQISASKFMRAFNQFTPTDIGAIKSPLFRIVLPHPLTRPVIALNLPNGQSRYFEETGHNVHHGFLRYFEATGGVENAGLPLTEEFQHNGRTLQYFERVRLEYYPEYAGTRYEVQLGLLGDELTTGRESFSTAAPFPSEPHHRYFTETNQGVHFGFLSFWESSGGLDRFGYPSSGEFREDGRTVQYFQRARFEWDPVAGQVRLGKIGSELLRRHGMLP